MTVLITKCTLIHFNSPYFTLPIFSNIGNILSMCVPALGTTKVVLCSLKSVHLFTNLGTIIISKNSYLFNNSI